MNTFTVTVEELDDASIRLWQLFDMPPNTLGRTLTDQVKASHGYAPERCRLFKHHMRDICYQFLLRGGFALFEVMKTRPVTQAEAEVLYRHFDIIIAEMTTYMDSLETASGRQSSSDDVLPAPTLIVDDTIVAAALRVAKAEAAVRARLSAIYGSDLNIISVAQAFRDAENQRGKSLPICQGGHS
jgi:hypothetical protein